MNEEKIKEINEVREKLESLVIDSLKKDKDGALKILSDTLKKILEEITDKTALEVMIESFESNSAETLGQLDLLKGFFIFSAKIFPTEENCDELWEEFSKDSVKQLKERKEKLEEPEENSETEEALLNKLNELLEEVNSD